MNEGIHDMDPLEREMDGEGHLALMGRDVLSPMTGRIYAVVRESSPEYKEKARAMLERLFIINDSRTKNPQKDSAHAWSVRAIADKMERFYNENIRGKPPVHRLHTNVEEKPPAPPPPPPRPMAVGDVIELTAPVNLPTTSEDPARLLQIRTGTIGTIRQIVEKEINPGAQVDFGVFRDLHFVRFDQMKLRNGDSP